MNWLKTLMALILMNSLKKQIMMLRSEILNLATTTALNAFENKIPKVGDLVKKQIMMKKSKTLRVNVKFAKNILHAKIKNKKLVNKSDISGFMNTNVSNENIQKMICKGRIKSRTRENRKITNI